MKNSENRKIGVWLDHNKAKLIEPGMGAAQIITFNAIRENKVHQPGESSNGTRLGNNRSTNDEWRSHHREQNELQSFFKELVKELKSYDDIFIFGPTTAPQEFRNLIHLDKDFVGKRIVVEHSDYLTDNQLVASVRNYYDRN